MSGEHTPVHPNKQERSAPFSGEKPPLKFQGPP